MSALNNVKKTGFSSWTGNSLGRRVGLPLVVGTFVLAAAAVYVVYTNQIKSVQTQASRQAEAVIAQMLTTRAVYTENIVAKLKADEAPVSFSPNFADTAGGIPLPATMVHLISERVSEQGLFQIDLISPWNINPEKGPQSAWEKEAVAALVDDPQNQQTTLETAGGRKPLAVYEGGLCFRRILYNLP